MSIQNETQQEQATVSVGIYRNAKDTQGVSRDMKLVYLRIKDGEKGLIEKTKTCNHLAASVAHAKDDADKKQRIKTYRDYKEKELPAFTPAGIFPKGKRKAQYLEQHSSHVVIDIDHITSDQIADLLVHFQKHPHTRLVFVSPSAKGLKIGLHVTPTPQNASEHKAAYQACVNYLTPLSEEYEFEIDQSGSDCSRLCFLAYHPQAIWQDDVIPIQWDDEAYQQEQEERKEQLANTEWTNTDVDISVLEHISPDCEYDTWCKIGMACYHSGLPFDVWDQWSQGSSKYNDSEMDKKWQSFGNGYAGDKVSWGTVVYHASLNGYEHGNKSQGSAKQAGTSFKEGSPYYIGKTFSPELLGTDVSTDISVISHNEDLFVYNTQKGFYEKDTGDVEATIRKKHGVTTATRHVNETKAYLLNAQRITIPHENVNFIPLKNGILDFESQTLKEHSPNNYLFNFYPVEWNQDSHCPQFDEFLTDIVPQDAVNLVYQMIGAIFHKESYRMQKAFLLVGGGANGKSLLLKIVEGIVGSSNICGLDWTTLAKPFAMSNIYNKAAAICTDMNTNGFIPREVKAAITGDTIECDRKYMTPIQFAPTCLWIACANEMPRTKDKTHGFYRRFIPISFPNSFEEDPTFERKMLQKCREEQSGILYTALSAYKQAWDKGCFDLPETTKHLQVSLREASDTIRTYIDNCIEFTDNVDDVLTRADVRDAYIDFCETEGYQADKKYANLYSTLRNSGSVDFGQKTVDGKRDRVLGKVRFK